ncbi:hypothetical protein DL766_003166 [Monosporascus sp. MC13-8B]|uniref:DUF7918 domain-containing protein n=1 Tax=Monosporascus cannonballus TaxID=155416 RepID=A0ABY0GZY1_9PEZI|nr:hypothetical protein DL762_008505 [Monosporascus cannonballus]RYO98160.1 hypothetical protein DL763_002401 [Monosporascus cannonballus]RYP34073.1 hypothetical protein DL766_003166 [Monosporascus sp. MC13-8B]
MAVLEALPEIKVTVRVEGKNCVEYEDPDAADIQASCPTSYKYIESVDYAEFRIHFHVDSDYNWDYMEHSLGVVVHVDNQELARTCLIKRQSDLDVYGRRVLLDDTTKARIEKDREVAKNLGIITVKLCRITLYANYCIPDSTQLKSSSLELTEKSFKGNEISHGTT